MKLSTSMTIDKKRLMTRAGTLFLSLSGILSGWLMVMAISGAFGKFDTLAVPLATQGFYHQLPDDVAIVGQVAGSLIFRGKAETLARDLRDAGAILIFPARADTCLSL